MHAKIYLKKKRNKYLRKGAKFTHAHTQTNLASVANDEISPDSEKSEFFKIKKNDQSDS